MLPVHESNLWTAKRAVERIKPVYEQNAASRKDFDEAQAAQVSAQAHVASAKARVKQAELNLGYTKIRSPISGLAGESTYSEGSLIVPNSSQYLTKVSTINPIYVTFHMSESDVLKHRREILQHHLLLPKDNNYDVQLTLADGTVYTALGKLDYTEPTFRPETGTMMLRALFPNPDEILRPGQFVRAKMLGAIMPDTIAIPQRAVLQGNKGMFVYLVKEGKAAVQEIEPGEWNDNDWIISAGLKKGDVVVIDGVDQIQPGSSVTTHEWSMTPNEQKH